MCGIAGIAPLAGRPAVDGDVVRRMCDVMVYRGPDDAGYDTADGVALGMRRLAIIDLAGGKQPIFNEDRSVRAVFNGEIYNFRQLRHDLERRGHRFNSSSDGEVLVHLWEEFGREFPQHLNGMYAVALHDLRQRRLVLVRDRLGIKPLYYSLDGERLVFGSEIKVLLASGLVARELDVDSLGQFFAWEYIPGGGTPLRSIRKLEPATLLDVDLQSGDAATRRYWDVPQPNGDAPRDAKAWEDAVDAKLSEAVRRQLVSDVPLGAFLSGGVDSSLVVAAMGEAKTYSIGFDDPSYNELRWARRVSQALQVTHRDELMRPQALELFDHLMQFMDDPIGDFSIFPTYLVSRLARQEVTVSLSGDGGDELFGGYETYLAQRMARWWRGMPPAVRSGWLEPMIACWKPRRQKKGFANKARRFVEGLQHDDGLGHARWRIFVGEAMREALFTPEALGRMTTPVGEHIGRLASEAGPRDEIDRALYVDLRSYLCDNCLVKVDRMSMACSLEARVPLLDHELVELAFQVPPRLKVSRGQTKILLKRVATRHVPRQCVYRPKEGFSIPIKNWLNDEIRPLVEDLLEPRRLAADGIFNVETVERLRREHEQGIANHSHVLWSLLVFQDWRRRWAA